MTSVNGTEPGGRARAAQLFNQTWELIEEPARTAEQDRLMLVTACASWLEWDAVGELPSWLRASALEGLARANAAAGRKDERDAYLTAATQALGDIDDPQDRDLIASQLSTVPEI